MDKPCVICHSLNDKGYPNGLKINGHYKRYHVIECEKQNGPCPDGYEASHLCGNRACIEKSHLMWETRSQNNLRKSPEIRKAASQQANEIRQDKAKGWIYRSEPKRKNQPYEARIKGKYIGRFATAEEAENAYRKEINARRGVAAQGRTP